jgi:hypothetical protein
MEREHMIQFCHPERSRGIRLSGMRSLHVARLCLALVGMTIFCPAFAAEEKKEETSAATQESEEPKDEKPESNPNRYAPDFCDFEITFPEKPHLAKKCVPGGQCYDLYSYTMVYDLQTTVDVSVTCNPSTPANFKRYTNGVMKAALMGMIDERNLTDYDIQFTEDKTTRSGALTGTGMTGAQNKIYTGQLWIGQNSVFTIQAELVGNQQKDADKAFSDILRSIKVKDGKQLPKKPVAKNNPSN